jgi:hypothetical protein
LLVSFATISAMLFGMAASALIYWALVRFPQSPRLAAPPHVVAPYITDFITDGRQPGRNRHAPRGDGTRSRVEAITVSTR